MVFSSGTSDRAMCPAPKISARSPSGRGSSTCFSSGAGAAPANSCPSAPISAARPPFSPRLRSAGVISAKHCMVFCARLFQRASMPGMRVNSTVTSPPHTMPISSILFFCRWNSCSPLCFFSSSSMAICSLRSSTVPPPMVPTKRPCAPTSIWLPLPRGADPSSATMVAIMVSWPFSIS